MGGRGLATACGSGRDKPLVDALAHPDLPFRSWVGEGLARLGDERALPVLAGTLSHDHLPIRLGAIMGFVALGPDGVRGILQGLDDQLREIQDQITTARRIDLIGTRAEVLVDACGVARSHREAPEIDGIVHVGQDVPVGSMAEIEIRDAVGPDLVAAGADPEAIS